MTNEFIEEFNVKCTIFTDFVTGTSSAYFEFHTSWDYLHLVIDKIESTYDKFHGRFQVFIVGNSCCIQGTNLDTSNELDYAYFSETYGKDKKEAVILAVNKFIDFYNKEIANKG